MDVGEWLSEFLEDDLGANAMTNQTSSRGGSMNLNVPFNASSGIGNSHWDWSLHPCTKNRDPYFLELQEANNIAKAAYQEFMRIAIKANNFSRIFVSHPVLGSIEDIQQMFQTPSPETRVDVSTESAVLPISPKNLLSIMFNMDEWVPTFSHIVFSGNVDEPPDVLKRLTSTDAAIRNILMVTAEFQLPTPFVKRHSFCFLRCLREIIPDIWAVVDVSVEYFGHYPGALSEDNCRRRPSGFIVRGREQNCEVIWVENMEWCENHLKNSMYSDIMDFNMVFSAKRWVSTLQWWLKRRSSRIRNAKTIRLNHRANICLLDLTESMKMIYMGLVTETLHRRWISLCNWDVRICRDTMRSNSYMAVTSFPVQAKPISVFNFLLKKNTELQWPSLLNFEEPEIVVTSTVEDHDENCITVQRKRIVQSESNEEFEYLLQEGSSDGFCYFIVSRFVTQQDVNGLLSSGTWSEDNGSQPSGFAILPDGFDGSLVTIVMHQVLNNLETDQVIENMENIIQSIIGEIRGGVANRGLEMID